jgi:hypothetical protein
MHKSIEKIVHSRCHAQPTPMHQKRKTMIQDRFRLSTVLRLPVSLSLALTASALVVLAFTNRSLAAQTFYTCTSVEVASFAERIHVRCDKPTNEGIVFFAVPTANSEHAARMLSILMMAHLTATRIVVLYDADDDGLASLSVITIPPDEQARLAALYAKRIEELKAQAKRIADSEVARPNHIIDVQAEDPLPPNQGET